MPLINHRVVTKLFYVMEGGPDGIVCVEVHA